MKKRPVCGIVYEENAENAEKGKRMYRVGKRVLDAVILLVLAPAWILVMAIVAILVKATSKGSVLFTQKRVGKGCSYFTIYKFRTMRMDTPADVPTHLLENSDAYITPVGAFLRKTSLDELPQLFNIIKGDLTLVGPRPALWNQEDLVAERERFGANDILPGITGWAQINGRDTISIEDKAAYDGYYKEHMGFWFDINILLLTVVNVLKRSGVQEGKG